MYTFDSRVRYSECDERGILSIEGMMNYLQDCSTFQSEDLGLGISYLRNARNAWWIQAWQIDIEKLPKLGDEIRMGTWAYGFKGFYGYRNFVIMDKDGNYYVKADSVWFHYNVAMQRPQRPLDEDIEKYMHMGGERLDMTPLIRKLSKGVDGIYKEEIHVQSHHLDSNHHVNNAKYIYMALDAANKREDAKRISVQYKTAAKLGDHIHPFVSLEQDVHIVDLQDGKGESFAIVRIE